MVIIPWYDKQLGIKVKDVIAVGDIEPEAFIWHEATGYGCFSHWEVNRTYAKQFLKDNFKWRLQASGDNITWSDANQLLNIGLDWNDADNGYKVTLTLNTTLAPKALYYRFDLACNKSLKQFVNRESTYNITENNVTTTHTSWNWELTVSANNTKDYTIVFNWDDIKSLVQSGKVWFDRDVKDNFFWFRIQTVNKIAVDKVFVVDPAYGVITQSTVSSYEWDTEEGRLHTRKGICRINNTDYYLIVFAGETAAEDDGWARVIQIWSNNGTIRPSVISSFEFNNADTHGMMCDHIPNTDKYVVYYWNVATTKAVIATLQIWANNGTIKQSLIDSQVFTKTSYNPPFDFVRLTNTVWVVAYAEGGTSYDGYLETVWIDSTGIINNTLLDIQEYNTVYALNPALRVVDTDTIAITAITSSSTGDFTLYTYNISSAGLITNTQADSWAYEPDPRAGSLVNKIGSTTYALTFCSRLPSTSSDIYTKTVTIANTGMITKSFIDTLLIDHKAVTTVGLDGIFVVHDPQTSVDGSGILGITYYSTSYDNWMFTWNVTSAGVMDATPIGSGYEFALANANTASVVYINQSWYHVSYAAADTHGWSYVFFIKTNWASAAFSSPSPANSSTGQALTPQCAITLNDMNGDLMTVNFYENSTGPYVLRQTNSSCANGTYRWTDAQATANNHKYWWKVYANDGLHNVSKWYCFTTVGTTPSRSWKNIVTGYLRGGNATISWRTISTGYLRGGNATQTWNDISSGYLRGGNATSWKTIFSGYLNGGNGTLPWRTITSGYEIGGNGTFAWQDIFSGYLNGGNLTISYNEIFSGYLTGNNITGYQNIFSGYETGGNTIISWNNISSGYLTGGNATVPWKDIISGYITGSNGTLDWNDLLSGYLTGGNITAFQNLFSGYLIGGNVTVSWQDIFSGYETGGNTTISWQNILSGYLTGGNTTVSYMNLFNGYLTGSNGTFPWRTITSGYITGSNATISWNDLASGYLTGGNGTSLWNDMVSGWFTGGNTTGLQTIFSGYLTGGNGTSPWQNIFSGYETGGNTTLTLNNIFSGYLTGGNGTSNWNNLFSGYLTGGTTTVNRNIFAGYLTGGNGTGANITISNPYPGNNSDHIKINVTLSITISHLNGNQMNITWYWGNSSANATHYLGSTLNVINGTYSMAITPANHTYTDYWWSVNVTSGSDYATGAFNFKTSVKSGGIIVADKKFVLGLCIGILLFFVLVMVMRSRKRND
jgi:hypothetical protein